MATCTIICKFCLKSKIVRTRKRYNNTFCSMDCFIAYKRANLARTIVICMQCGKQFAKENAYMKKQPFKHFCTMSCRATYANKHKLFGRTNRSKLEIWIAEKLNIIYPNMYIVYNDREQIGLELDIFIPEHRLAFELNGIYHYEPIYGLDSFTYRQKLDKNKFSLCSKYNISLCVIDTSAAKNFKPERDIKYLNIITNIIDENIKKTQME